MCCQKKLGLFWKHIVRLNELCLNQNAWTNRYYIDKTTLVAVRIIAIQIKSIVNNFYID